MRKYGFAFFGKKGTVMREIVNQADTDILVQKIEILIEESRKRVVTQVDSVMVRTYYEIGRAIVENQQHGEVRAGYGKGVLKQLSQRLNAKFGKGFSVDNLENMRKFYLTYRDTKSETVSRISQKTKSETVSRISDGQIRSAYADFTLSWSHYLFLMRIENIDERHFYEMESGKNNWNLRELKRQFNSALYERLALSTEKDKVMELSRKGQVVERASDVIKDPYILEFLGLKEKPEYSESDLESRIIDHLQEFLMEMGKGFTFVGRQVRFTFDEEHFRVDLVLYNRLLRCFVLVDLKIGKLRHQDLGQMQMYVNYYDRYEKTGDENPTIGILLCNEKSDSMVELTLPKDSNIYASKYELYLPDKKLLQEKLIEWLREEDGNE